MLPPDDWLGEAEQHLLLRLGRRALEEAVRSGRLFEPPEAKGRLSESAGVFVTLYKKRALRGCIGQIQPKHPLYRTVCECAVAAALNDPRFLPVMEGELSLVRAEISVLSPMFDVLPEQIEIGRHGLLASLGLRRGLLLPQVALEWN